MLAPLGNLVRRDRALGESGASAVEYALLVAAIAALCAAMFFAFGGVVKTTFIKSCSNVATQSSAGTQGTC